MPNAIENAARWLQPTDGDRPTDSTQDRYHGSGLHATMRVERAFQRNTLTELERNECSSRLQRVSFLVRRTLASTSAAISCIQAVKS